VQRMRNANQWRAWERERARMLQAIEPWSELHIMIISTQPEEQATTIKRHELRCGANLELIRPGG
jgi:hypothetical protein